MSLGRFNWTHGLEARTKWTFCTWQFAFFKWKSVCLDLHSKCDPRGTLGLIGDDSALVRVMPWCRTGHQLLPEHGNLKDDLFSRNDMLFHTVVSREISKRAQIQWKEYGCHNKILFYLVAARKRAGRRNIVHRGSQAFNIRDRWVTCFAKITENYKNGGEHGIYSCNSLVRHMHRPWYTRDNVIYMCICLCVCFINYCLLKCHVWQWSIPITYSIVQTFSLCCVLFGAGTFRFYRYPPGSLHWHRGNHTIAPVPVKQPWKIWVNGSHGSVI